MNKSSPSPPHAARETASLATRRAQSGPHHTGPSARQGTTKDSTTRMFNGIRRRMALWYSGILAVILVLAGILVYAAMYQVELGQQPGLIHGEAHEQAEAWGENGAVPQACFPATPEQLAYFVACYDPSGTLMRVGGTPLVNSQRPPENPLFLTHGIVGAALANHDGTATDWASRTITFDVPSSSDGPEGDQPNRQGAPPPPQSGTQTQTIVRYAEVVRDDNGTTLGVIVVGLDISSELHALDVLRLLLVVVGGVTLAACGIGGAILSHRALEPARLAFTRQQTFIADASHELRTPLTLMRANAEVLLTDAQALSADDVQLVHSLIAEVEHMGAVTTQLLELARLDAGAIRPEEEAIHLGALAGTLAQHAQAHAQARHMTLSVSVEGDPVVIGDRVQLTEVGLILLDNAIKYNSEGGTVALLVGQTHSEATLTVRDSGPGIPREHLARLGERFYRVDKARSRKLGGAGLGLSIAHRIATLHKGTLTLRSEPGQGTAATLALPLASAPPGEAKNPSG